MSQDRSDSDRHFSPLAALAITVLGIVAMVGGSLQLAHVPWVGLRGKIAIGTLLLALPALAALLLFPDKRPAVLGVGAPSRRITVLSVLLGVSLWVASAGLMEVQSLLAPPPTEYLDAFRALHRALMPKNALDAVVSVLVIAILPGVCEELLVRGVCLPALARWFSGAREPQERRRITLGLRPPWLAILVSALLFGIIHDPFRFSFTFVLGLVFGFIRLCTRLLWPSVIAHTTLNMITFAIAPLVDDPTQPYVPSPVLGAACLLLGTAMSWPLLRAFAARAASPTTQAS
jgi:membrane protease YdiL (CAAX protease family)